MLMQIERFKATVPIFAGIQLLARATYPMPENEITESTWIPCDQFARITGAAFADQDGTLEIQFSNDRVNADWVRTIPIEANDTEKNGIDQIVLAPYVKFVFTNGPVAQTVFRMFVYVQSNS